MPTIGRIGVVDTAEISARIDSRSVPLGAGRGAPLRRTPALPNLRDPTDPANVKNPRDSSTSGSSASGSWSPSSSVRRDAFGSSGGDTYGDFEAMMRRPAPGGPQAPSDRAPPPPPRTEQFSTSGRPPLERRGPSTTAYPSVAPEAAARLRPEPQSLGIYQQTIEAAVDHGAGRLLTAAKLRIHTARSGRPPTAAGASSMLAANRLVTSTAGNRAEVEERAAAAMQARRASGAGPRDPYAIPSDSDSNDGSKLRPRRG
jgi:hypothetical protein